MRAFSMIGRMAMAAAPPNEAVRSCGTENRFDITADCCSGRLSTCGTNISTIPV